MRPHSPSPLPFGFSAAILLLAAAPPDRAFAQSRRAEAYALTGARVVTAKGPVLENAVVVLRDGLIEAVGPSVKVPPDVRVIDAKGLTVTPGLIDAFSGLGLPGPGGRGGSGGGGGSSPPAANPLAPQSMVLDRFRAPEALKARDSAITTALVVSRAGVLPGQSVLVNLSGDKAEGMVLRQPAAQHLHLNELSRRYPNALMGTMALARQSLLDARHYGEEWAAYEKAPAGKKRPRFDPALASWQD